MEARRKGDAVAAAGDLESLRRRAREESRAWRGKLEEVERSSASGRAEEEKKLAAAVEEGKTELSGLRAILSDEEARIKREKDEIEGRARAAAGRPSRKPGRLCPSARSDWRRCGRWRRGGRRPRRP